MPYRRSHAGQLAALAIIALLALSRWQGWLPESPASRPQAEGSLPPGLYVVERVVDGDTIVLRRGERVRLQGINCPELEHDGQAAERFGPEAKAFTARFLEEADKNVRIEIDGETADHYGRWLAFVWREDRLLNEELVRAGLARAMLRYDYSQAKKDRLRAAQLEAQRGGRGMWASE